VTSGGVEAIHDVPASTRTLISHVIHSQWFVRVLTHTNGVCEKSVVLVLH
jgi:hypothetical protein